VDLNSERFFDRKWLLWVVVGLAFVLGLGIRAYDITDPPFDFHATRQLRAAVIARGMYYQGLEDAPEWQRQQADMAWHEEAIIEPPVMERLAAWGYQLAGSEQLWIPRSLSAIFWCLAGLAVWLLGRELSAADGGVPAIFYFLFLPYSIYATRTFQPDPLMVCLIAWSLWAVSRWHRERTTRMAIVAGVLGGLAIFVKTVAIFFVGGAFIGLILLGAGLAKAIRDKQVWLMGLLTILPTSLFYVYGLWIAGFLQRQLSYRFFPSLWCDPAFYIRWQEMATNICGYGTLLAALAALFLVRDRGKRGFLAGLWIGYGLYSMTFAYHTLTHDYYQLPLILVISVSLIAVAAELLKAIAAIEKGLWVRLFIVLLLFAGAAFKIWDVRVNLIRDDYRGEAAFWEKVGGLIEPGARVLAMSQTYGNALSYYGWTPNDSWASEGDINLRVLAGASAEDIEQSSYAAIEHYDYFVITKVGEFDDTPELKELLYNNYTVFAEGEDYIIFDLRP